MAKGSEKKVTDKTIDAVENAVDKFTESIESTQRMVLRKVNGIVRNLDVKNDSIQINRNNLKVVRQLEDELRKIVISPAYKKKLEEFLKAFEKLKDINKDYFLSLIPSFNESKQVFGLILNSSLDSTKGSLLRAGIDQAIISPVVETIKQGITSGMFISDLEESLRVEIIGDPDGKLTGRKRKGKLLRYTKQITRDALNQFSRNYVTTVSKEYRLEWFYYDGSVIQDTRSYCKERAGRYFHKKEVQRSANRSWAGKIANTNRSTIFTYCGGYNCRHEYLPVLKQVVPKSVVRRNIRNGNYEGELD